MTSSASFCSPLGTSTAVNWIHPRDIGRVSAFALTSDAWDEKVGACAASVGFPHAALPCIATATLQSTTGTLACAVVSSHSHAVPQCGSALQTESLRL